MQTSFATDQAHRVISLDVIRGLAVLGILMMNIQSFAMPDAAYMNPTAFGDLTGLNRWVWAISHVFIDTKFISLFSILFGVGVLLFCERADKHHTHTMNLHFRRMGWLLLFGLIHGYLIWSGDVLFAYAVCGFWVVFFRHLSVRVLWSIGLLFVSIPTFFDLLMQQSLPLYSDWELEPFMETWQPDAEQIAADIALFSGHWGSLLQRQIQDTIAMQTYVLLYYMVWRSGGLMLIGMALYKQGVFSGNMSLQTMRNIGGLLLVAGLVIVTYGIHFNFSHHWDIRTSQFLGLQFNAVGSVLMALGYILLLNLMIQKQLFTRATALLAKVGRMAFTNYIMQSLICTFLFYGFGLGWYGQVERWQQALIVICIWIFQLMMSGWWLARYRFGPLEWVWRKLTYWR